ncbi:MAG: DNA-binding protein [Haloplanus sp.]
MTPEIRTAVPEDATPAGRCEHCGRPFPTADRLVLHKGVDHPRTLDDDERSAFESARAEEAEALRRLRLEALAALVALYFGFLFLYAIFA